MPDSHREHAARHWYQSYLTEVSAKCRQEFLCELDSSKYACPSIRNSSVCVVRRGFELHMRNQ